MQNFNFNFEISLSVLNHLGRNLYRSFNTVLGEAISNSWDADAASVRICINRENNRFTIMDDGIGMSREDFQEKFLRIGYSKRRDGVYFTESGRRFIGQKGIGKLALLSCAEKITVISKAKDKDPVGGVIVNSSLDNAIASDRKPSEYPLELPPVELVEWVNRELQHGTLIQFDDLRAGVRNRVRYLERLIALHYRFSLFDDSFQIFLNDSEITISSLKDIATNTEFAWQINQISDPYIDTMLCNLKKPIVKLQMKNIQAKGFVASVIKPSQLKILGDAEKAGIDLFVNGRLRERDILRHISDNRLPEKYLYGQIHFDELDDNKDNKDRFTSNRDGIVDSDPLFESLLQEFQSIVRQIYNYWDSYRIDTRQSGDNENTQMTEIQRSSREVYNKSVKEYELAAPWLNEWTSEIEKDAEFNIQSYCNCFIAENLIRKYARETSKIIKDQSAAERRRKEEEESKAKGNINFKIREQDDDLNYLGFEKLAKLCDKSGTTNSLVVDAKLYKPIRDALMHTAILTCSAKDQLSITLTNIKNRIKKLAEEANFDGKS